LSRGGAALWAGVTAVLALATACARTPLPFVETEDASQFGPIAPYDAGRDPGGGFGAGPGDPDAGVPSPPVEPADLMAACGRNADFSLWFEVADDRPRGVPRSEHLTGFLSRVEPGVFALKLNDRVAAFALTRPSGAAIPFSVGERVTLAYRIELGARPGGGAPTWAVTLTGDEGPRYAARSGRADLPHALLGLSVRGERADCNERYLGDCINAQEAVALLEHPNGRAVALGSGRQSRVDTPEAGPVRVTVHAALDDRDACAPEETWGLYVALEMER
jgi:hypothetical protein